MKLLRRFPALAFTLILIGIVAFFVAHQAIDLLLVTGVLAAMSWYITEGPRGKTLPKWAATVIMIAAVVNALVDGFAYRGQLDEFVGVIGRFSVWLTLIKLYEPKQPRDYTQLLALSVVTVLAGCLETVELLFALLLIPYVCLGMYVLMLYQLYAGYQNNRAQRIQTAQQLATPTPPAQAVGGAGVLRQFRGLAVSLVLAGAVLSVIIFAVFPRGYGEAIGSRFGDIGHRRSGFSPQVRLREPVRISESRKIVFTVRLLDHNDRIFQPSSPPLFRGAVLEGYNNEEGRWYEIKSSNYDQVTTSGGGEAVSFTPSRVPPKNATGMVTQEFEIAAMSSNRLFSIYAPYAISTQQPNLVRMLLPRLTMISPRSGKPRQYSILATQSPSKELLQSLVGNANRPRIVKINNQQIITLAKKILKEKGIAERPDEKDTQVWQHNRKIANAFKTYLQTNGFTYTTDLSEMATSLDEDPIIAFLTRWRRGNCEHFAAALAMLCRGVGVEARLVTGYVGMEYDSNEQQYIVRESNAHAWVEVRTSEYGWTQFDATPVGEFDQIRLAERSWSDQLRWLYDSFEMQWNSNVIAFDRAQQSELAETLNGNWVGTLKELGNKLRERLIRINRGFRLGPAGYIWMGTVALALIIAIFALIKLMRRTQSLIQLLKLRPLPRTETARLLRQLGFYLDMLTVLARAGHAKPHWQPPREYATALAARRPDIADIVNRLVAAFYRARYGGAILSRDEIKNAHELVNELSQRLQAEHKS